MRPGFDSRSTQVSFGTLPSHGEHHQRRRFIFWDTQGANLARLSLKVGCTLSPNLPDQSQDHLTGKRYRGKRETLSMGQLQDEPCNGAQHGFQSGNRMQKLGVATAATPIFMFCGPNPLFRQSVVGVATIATSRKPILVGLRHCRDLLQTNETLVRDTVVGHGMLGRTECQK